MYHASRPACPVLLVLIVALAAGVVSAQQAVPQRSDIEDQYKWDLTKMFPTTGAWNTAFAQVEGLLPQFDTYKGHLGDSPETLLNCLRLNDSVNMLNDQLFVYAGLQYDQDQRESQSQEMQGRSQSLNSRVGAATSFIVPEILTVGKDKLLSFLDASDELKLYRFYLEDLLRTQEHTLSPREEEMLSLLYPVASGPGNIFNAFNNADVRFGIVTNDEGEQIEMTRQRYRRLLESTNRDVRRAANQEYVGTYRRYLNGMAACLATSFQTDWFFTQVRKYNTCLERRLDQDNIPSEVFHNLIDAVSANLAPLHKWTSLKKRILGLDTLYTYDLNAPLIDLPPKDYTWEQAKEMVHHGLAPMGEVYLADVDVALNSRWIDVYETQGKEGGGYNWGAYPMQPYIKMNYDGSIDNVFTLAHEIGHAIHRLYRYRTEPYVYAGSTTFTAEVASTAHEAMLMKYLLDNTPDKQEKLQLLIHYIDEIEGVFYTQVFFSEFELAMHEQVESGGAFSADFMRQHYRDLYLKYWGPDIVVDSLNDMGCVRLPHFYRNYYVFQYATGYAAAQAVAQRVLNNEPGAIDALVDFLHKGSSQYAIDILKDAGVDMTTPEPVDRTIQLFGQLVDEVERLLNEK